LALREGPWLFSPRLDLAAFAGSALLSFLLLWIGSLLGVLHGDTPNWAWVPVVVLVDVAHVWATIFRVYLDSHERRRRPLLYWGTPAWAFSLALVCYLYSPSYFWRGLAYLAVFHFVRQQYGWVALYRGRAKESGAFDRWIDTAAIYAASVFPLIHWHAHLPQNFWWFIPGDFARLPSLSAEIAEPIYWLVMFAYVARLAWRHLVSRNPNPGKDVVVLTTAICWYVGIVHFNSDYAFTVTNVIIHGVPYFVLIYRLGRRRVDQGAPGGVRLLRLGPAAFVVALACLAFAEEMGWDRLLWHDRPWLFGGGIDITGLAEAVAVAVLVVPQLTHYVLDAFIWRRRSNPGLSGSF
jgi:hypothetical protein